MKILRIRPIAALLLASLTAGTLPLRAWAGDRCVAFPAGAATAAKVDEDYIGLLSDYFDHHGAASPLMTNLRATKVRQHVFSHVESDPARYEAELRFLDKYSRVSPEASFELAKRLQLHWEKEYGLSTLRVRSESQTTGFEAGGIIGLGVLGALMLKSPASAPRYFRLVRHLLPVGTMVAGHAAGTAHAAIINNGSVPISPAHLVRLGSPEALDDQAFTNEDLYQGAVAMMASVSASSAFVEAWTVIRGAEALNVAATPMKWNPYVFVGSIVVGGVVDYGVRAGLEAHEKSTLVDAVRRAAEQLRTAARTGDAYARFAAADAFVEATLRLAAYLNVPMAEVVAESAQAETEAAKKWSNSPERLQVELSRIAAERDAELASQAPYAVGLLNSTIEKYAVAQALATDGTAEGLGARAESALATQKRLQARYVLEQGEAYGIPSDVCYASDAEKAREFADAARGRVISELAGAITAGRIPEDPLLLQLSAAAFLESMKNAELEEFANTLFAQVEHGLLQRRLLQPNGG